MTNTFLKAVAVTATVGAAALTMSAPAYAWHDGPALGAGLFGFAAGAIVGSALAPRTVVVAPPPPPPAYAVAYGPPAWSPEWYNYCGQRYRSFNPQTGYFIGMDGNPYFCR